MAELKQTAKTNSTVDDSAPKAIVIDNGSALTKIGFSGESAPRFVFPTVVTDLSKVAMRLVSIAGDEAIEKRKDIRLKAAFLFVSLCFTLFNPVPCRTRHHHQQAFLSALHDPELAKRGQKHTPVNELLEIASATAKR